MIKCTVCVTRYSDSKYNCPYCDYPTAQNLKEYRLQKVYDNEKGFFQESNYNKKEFKVKSWSERLKNNEVSTSYDEAKRKQVSQTRQVGPVRKSEPHKVTGKSIVRFYIIIIAVVVLFNVVQGFIRMNPFLAYEINQFIDSIFSSF